MSIAATPISEARRLGRMLGVDRVVIITMDSNNEWCLTTWGKTRSLCRALGEWADTEGDTAVRTMEIATTL